MSSKAKPKKAAKAVRSMTKSQLVSEVATKAGLSKSQVTDVMNSLVEVIGGELRASRPISIPGLVKISLVRKPATPARPGFNNFTKEAIIIKAKPARSVVKVRALKVLKDMA